MSLYTRLQKAPDGFVMTAKGLDGSQMVLGGSLAVVLINDVVCIPTCCAGMDIFCSMEQIYLFLSDFHCVKCVVVESKNMPPTNQVPMSRADVILRNSTNIIKQNAEKWSSSRSWCQLFTDTLFVPRYTSTLDSCMGMGTSVAPR